MYLRFIIHFLFVHHTHIYIDLFDGEDDNELGMAMHELYRKIKKKAETRDPKQGKEKKKSKTQIKKDLDKRGKKTEQA